MQDTDDTRGLSQRELLLEVRQDVKEIRSERTKFMTRPEAYGSLGAVSVLLAMFTRFLGGN